MESTVENAVGGAHLAAERTYERVDELSRQFRDAKPFPHVVIDDALVHLDAVVDSFPGPEWNSWNQRTGEYAYTKKFCNDIDVIPVPLGQMIHQLNSPRFLSFLEELSGISSLIPDPYLFGGGLHCSGPGGVLRTHTDFHLYERLGIYRRLNVLVYLNDEWDESWGGCLELFAPGADKPGDVPVQVVVPRLGTMVVFRTNDKSPHGFNQPISDGRWRKSVALYYYTAAEDEDYSGDTNTYWRQERAAPGWRRARQQTYEGLIGLSRSLGRMAHWVDPKRKPLRKVR